MPQSKLTPEDLFNIYKEAEPKIDRFAESLWDDHFNNSRSDLYLGQSYQEGLKRAALDLGSIGFYFDPKKGNEPLIENYLRERGGNFITWMSNSQKKEFAISLLDAYTTTGSYKEFKDLFKETFPGTKDWKALQIWVTENNVAANKAAYDVYGAYKIPGFEVINAAHPCEFCVTESMYTHRYNEAPPPYHVFSYVYDVNSEVKDHILLKNKGWTLIYDVEVGDVVFSLNPETKEIETVKVLFNYIKPYKGNLIHLYNNDSDILVTEDHRMIYLENNKIESKEIKFYDKHVMFTFDESLNIRETKDLNKEIIYYDGFVCGLTLEKNHTLFLKRNNKYLVSSNCQCIMRPVLEIEHKKDPNGWKQHMTETQKERFEKNYEKFNPLAKATPINLTEKDMKRAIDDILTRQRFEQNKYINPNKNFNPIKDPYNKLADKVVTKLSTKDQLAIKQYSNTFENVQKTLLGSKNLKPPSGFKDMNEYIKYLDMAMENNKLPSDTLLYRGISEDMAKNFKLGQTFEHKTFMSTSQNLSQAQYFSQRNLLRKIEKILDEEQRYGFSEITLTEVEKRAAIHVMELKVPKGTSGFSMKQYSFYKDEKEILLNRGLKLRLVDIKEGYDKIYKKDTFNYVFEVV